MRKERDDLRESSKLMTDKSVEDAKRWQAVEEVLTTRLSKVTAEAKALQIKLDDLKAKHSKSEKAWRLERKSSAQKLKQARETVTSLHEQLDARAETVSELEMARESIAQELARAVEQRNPLQSGRVNGRTATANVDIEARNQVQGLKQIAAAQKIAWLGRTMEGKERLWGKKEQQCWSKSREGGFREKF